MDEQKREKRIKKNLAMLGRWMRKTDKRVKKLGPAINSLDYRIKMAKQGDYTFFWYVILHGGLDHLEAKRKSLRDELAFCKNNLRGFKQAVRMLETGRFRDFNRHRLRLADRIETDVARLEKQRKPLTIKEQLEGVLKSDLVLHSVAMVASRRVNA